MNGLLFAVIVAVSPIFVISILTLFYSYKAWKEKARK